MVSYSKSQNLSDTKIFLSPTSTLAAFFSGCVSSLRLAPISFAPFMAAHLAAILLAAPTVPAEMKPHLADRTNFFDSDERALVHFSGDRSRDGVILVTKSA